MDKVPLNRNFYIGKTKSSYYLFNSKKNLLYDIEEIDYEVLKRLRKKNEKQVVDSLQSLYKREEIWEAIRDIKIQLEGGNLKPKTEYLEDEYQLIINLETLVTDQHFIYNFVQHQLGTAYCYQFKFVQFTEEKQLDEIINFIDKINEFISGKPQIAAFKLVVPIYLCSNTLIKKEEKKNLKLIGLAQEKKDLIKVSRLTNKSKLMEAKMKITADNLNYDWLETIKKLWSSQHNLEIDYYDFILGVVNSEADNNLEQKVQLLKEELKQVQQLFVELSKTQEQVADIYPFKSKFKLLDKQKNKEYLCRAGRKKFYLQDGKIYPCRKSCQRDENLNIKQQPVLNSDCQSKYYQTVVKNNSQCINCFARGLCGGYCPQYKMLSQEVQNLYCKLEQFIVELTIEAYKKLSE